MWAIQRASEIQPTWHMDCVFRSMPNQSKAPHRRLCVAYTQSYIRSGVLVGLKYTMFSRQPKSESGFTSGPRRQKQAPTPSMRPSSTDASGTLPEVEAHTPAGWRSLPLLPTLLRLHPPLHPHERHFSNLPRMSITVHTPQSSCGSLRLSCTTARNRAHRAPWKYRTTAS